MEPELPLADDDGDGLHRHEHRSSLSIFHHILGPGETGINSPEYLKDFDPGLMLWVALTNHLFPWGVITS